MISDRDQIIAVSGTAKKDFLNKPIGQAVEQIMEERKAVIIGETAIHPLFRGAAKEDNPLLSTLYSQIIAPIIAEGDPIGAVIIAAKDEQTKMGDLELKLAVTAASFLAKQMEQ